MATIAQNCDIGNPRKSLKVDVFPVGCVCRRCWFRCITRSETLTAAKKIPSRAYVKLGEGVSLFSLAHLDRHDPLAQHSGWLQPPLDLVVVPRKASRTNAVGEGTGRRCQWSPGVTHTDYGKVL